MIPYGTIEKREGSYGLQEVVKDYNRPEWRKARPYSIASFKIVRTPNQHKLNADKKIIGEDYKIRVVFSAANGYRLYFPAFCYLDSFPDSQDGLDQAEKFAEHLEFFIRRNLTNHPKKWPFMHRSQVYKWLSTIS